jgi:hypothetical protein
VFTTRPVTAGSSRGGGLGATTIGIDGGGGTSTGADTGDDDVAGGDVVIVGPSGDATSPDDGGGPTTAVVDVPTVVDADADVAADVGGEVTIVVDGSAATADWVVEVVPRAFTAAPAATRSWPACERVADTIPVTSTAQAHTRSAVRRGIL